MKAKILSLIAGLFVASLAHSDILYWQIDPASGISTTGWNYVSLFSESSSGALNNIDPSGTRVAISNLGGTDTWYVSEVGNNTADKFYIEIYSDLDSTSPIGWSSHVAFTDLRGFANSDLHSAQVNVHQFQAVPEPTSGLMLLVGMAMLGLRRRKVA